MALLIFPDVHAARKTFIECLDEHKNRAEALELADSYNHDEVRRAFMTGLHIIFRRSSKIDDCSDIPYGVLVKHSAMCNGYSSTFQLLMALLNIVTSDYLRVSGIHNWDTENVPKAEGRRYRFIK